MLNYLAGKFRRITTNQLYLPEIDGIRFLAIVLVVLFHTHGYFVAKTTLKFADDISAYHLLNTFLENGGRGVELFFVLSGFILCLPFAHQYINNGKKVRLGKYYLRRVTRLEPPYIIAMTAILLIHLATNLTPASVIIPSWGASLIYAHNIIYHHTPLLTVVAWSLEIEIQFYLLAPLLFSLLALRKTTRRTILFAATLLLLISHKYYTPPFPNIYNFAQYFFIGILLADFYVSDTAASFFNKKWMALPAAVLLIAIMYWPVREPGAAAGDLFPARLAFPFLLGLFYYMIMKNEVIKKVFSYKFIPVIGGMCYSIYLLHYTIISVLGRFTMGFHLTEYYIPNLLLQFFLIGAPVLIISSVYYYFIERPFMSSKWLDMLIKKDKKEETTNFQPTEKIVDK